MLAQQAQVIDKLQNNSSQATQTTNVTAQTNPAVTPKDTIEDRLTKVEEQTKKTNESIAKNQLGTLGFSGDLRMQYDSQYGLLNNAANVNNSAILGNELSSRQRIRCGRSDWRRG